MIFTFNSHESNIIQKVILFSFVLHLSLKGQEIITNLLVVYKWRCLVTGQNQPNKREDEHYH